jgi:polysaccharide biosynthesis protein PslE
MSERPPIPFDPTQGVPRRALAEEPANLRGPRPLLSGRELTLDQCVARLRMGWAWCLAAGVLLGFVTLVVSALSAPKYLAEGSVVVTLGREFRYTGSDPRAERTSMFRLVEAVNSEVELLESRGLAQRVLDELGIERVYPSLADGFSGTDSELREKAVDAFRQDLTVIPVPDSSVIRLLFRHTDPSLAADVVGAAIDNLIVLHLQIFGEGRSEALEARVVELEARLQERRAELTGKQRSSGLFDSQGQVSARIAELSALELELERTRNRAVQVRAALEADQPETLQSVGPNGNDGALAQARSELLRLTLEEQILRRNYLEDSRAVQTVRESRAAVRDFLVNSLRTDLAGLEARSELLHNQVATTAESILDLEQRGQELERLELDVAMLQEHLDEQLRNLEDARLSADLDKRKQASVQPLDPAAIPIDPLGAPLWLKLFGGFVAGLLMGAAILLTAPVLFATAGRV